MGSFKAPRQKNIGKTLLRLFKDIFRNNFMGLFTICMCVVLSALTTVYIATIVESLIDEYIIPLTMQDKPDFSILVRQLGKWGIIMAVSVLSNYILLRVVTFISTNVFESFRNQMFIKMQEFPVRYFDKHEHGTLMSLFTNDVDSLQQMIGQAFSGILQSTLTLIFVFIAMLMNSWILTVVIVITIIVLLYTLTIVGKKGIKNFAKQQESLSEVNSYIEEMMNGARVVKVFAREETCCEEFNEINEKLRVRMRKANTLANVIMPIANGLGHFQYVILILIGAVLCLLTNGAYSVGALAGFLQLSESFTSPLAQIASQMNGVFLAIAGADRIYNLLDSKVEVDKGDVVLVERGEDLYWKDKDELNKVEGLIEMNKVKFSFDDRDFLNDVSITIKPGQKISFVGETGAGKTTIANLISRFYDIKKGQIKIDGHDIRNIEKESLRDSFGLVLQTTSLFTASVKDNIKYGKLDATDEEVIEAAKIANAHDFILSLEDGYDTILENAGAVLSQGQRQLLSIARAAIKNAPIMILDEATGSIDSHTEALVQDSIDKLMKDRTILVIAHRLSTVKNSDAIVVLEDGEIVEIGNHAELIEKKGAYFDLYTESFELD